MDKLEIGKKGALMPTPKIIVSCRDSAGNNNALAVAYCCNCSYDPPMIMVGVVPSRHSYHMIKESGCFIVNLVKKDDKEIFDYLGSHSGKDEDKFSVLNLKWSDGDVVSAPLLDDCPVNIECSVVDSIMTGSHEMFVGKVEKVHADKSVLDDKLALDMDKLNLL